MPKTEEELTREYEEAQRLRYQDIMSSTMAQQYEPGTGRLSTGWVLEDSGEYSYINPLTGQMERSFAKPQIIQPEQDPRRQMQQQTPEISPADRAFEEIKGEDWAAIGSQHDRGYKEIIDKWASEDNELYRQSKNDPDNEQYYKNLMEGLRKKKDDAITMLQSKTNEKTAAFQMNWAGNKRQFDLFNELAGKGELSPEEIERAKYGAMGMTYPTAVATERSMQQRAYESTMIDILKRGAEAQLKRELPPPYFAPEPGFSPTQLKDLQEELTRYIKMGDIVEIDVQFPMRDIFSGKKLDERFQSYMEDYAIDRTMSPSKQRILFESWSDLMLNNKRYSVWFPYKLKQYLELDMDLDDRAELDVLISSNDYKSMQIGLRRMIDKYGYIG